MPVGQKIYVGLALTKVETSTLPPVSLFTPLINPAEDKSTSIKVSPVATEPWVSVIYTAVEGMSEFGIIRVMSSRVVKIF